MRKQRTGLTEEERNLYQEIDKAEVEGKELQEQIKTLKKLLSRIKYAEKKYELSEQTETDRVLIILALLGKHHLKMINFKQKDYIDYNGKKIKGKQGLDCFDKESLERVSTSLCVKMGTHLIKLREYGIKPNLK